MIIVAIGKNLPSSFMIINQNSKPILFSASLGSIAAYAKDFCLKHCPLKLHNYAQFVNLHTIHPIQLLATQLVKPGYLFCKNH
jgi:hypothetical protein